MPLFQPDLPENITDALEVGNSTPLPISGLNPTSTKAFGMPKSYLAVTDWDQGAIATNWTQTLASGAVATVSVVPLAGNMGVYRLASNVSASGRAGLRFGTAANLLTSFTDANYTSLGWRFGIPGLPILTQKTLTFTVVAGVFALFDTVTNGLGASGVVIAINVATTVITLGLVVGTFAIGNTITSGVKSGTVTNVQNGYNSTYQFGWINTATQAAGQSGNTLAIMWDPANISGFNPTLITNFFLLARCGTGQTGGTVTPANTILDLGVAPVVNVFDNWEMIYDNILGEVRVYKNDVLLNTLTNLSNVPGSPTRPILASNQLSPTWYVGNATTTALGTSGLTVDMDKTIIYKVFS